MCRRSCARDIGSLLPRRRCRWDKVLSAGLRGHSRGMESSSCCGLPAVFRVVSRSCPFQLNRRGSSHPEFSRIQYHNRVHSSRYFALQSLGIGCSLGFAARSFTRTHRLLPGLGKQSARIISDRSLATIDSGRFLYMSRIKARTPSTVTSLF